MNNSWSESLLNCKNLNLWFCFTVIPPPLLKSNIKIIRVYFEIVFFFRYLCQVKDSHLRAAGHRNMFEFMWTAVKDPLDGHATFDKEGLDLAFKYFSSSTLTMRLAGISQINVSWSFKYTDLFYNQNLSIESEKSQ